MEIRWGVAKPVLATGGGGKKRASFGLAGLAFKTLVMIPNAQS